MEYIEGERIIDYMHDHDKKQVLLILGKIIDQLRVMDNLNINKLELTNPYKHIIIKKSEPIQIDFERCQYTEKPKNITQFVQFLVSGKIQYIFNEKSIRLDKDKMLDIAKDYKKDYDEKYVKELIRCIK